MSVTAADTRDLLVRSSAPSMIPTINQPKEDLKTRPSPTIHVSLTITPQGSLYKIVSNLAGFYDNEVTPAFQDVSTDSAYFQGIGRLASCTYICGCHCDGSGETCLLIGNLPYFGLTAMPPGWQISKIVSNEASLMIHPAGRRNGSPIACSYR